MAGAKKLIAPVRAKRAAWALPVPTTLLWMLALFGLALLPRILPWGTIVTVDEAYHWFRRAAVFLRAVQNGDYADTNLVGHPGVTTMWLGAIGLMLQRALVALGWASYEDPAIARGLMRLPVAIVTSAAIALAYPLLRRLLDRRVALLGVLFWAADPFLVAHSGLLHLDALLASFVTLALLAALAACLRPPDQPFSWPLLVASGGAGGLALLTKSPSLLLLPMVVLIALVAALRQQDAPSGTNGRWLLLWREVVLPMLAWLGTAMAVWVALWPAAWVDLPGALGRVVAQARDDGGVPHAWGNFFLGSPVADPGPFFYPVAVALHLTPWALLGCLAACWLVLRFIWSGTSEKGRIQPQSRQSAQSQTFLPLRAPRALRLNRIAFQLSSTQLVVALLALFALAFLVAMSLPPKKFDRYALPVFPALNVIAAAGIMRMLDWKRAIIQHPTSNIQHPLLFLCLVPLLALQLAWYHPYYLAYYNPLLGGGAVAARAIPVGWGEGYEQVAAFLKEQPEAGQRPVAAWFPPVLSALLPGEIGPLRWAVEPGKVDYAVLYIDQVQRGDEPEVTARLRGTLTPAHVVRIHGIDYAEIYRIPPPVARPVAATFGDVIALRGYDIDTSALRASGVVTLTLQWRANADVGRDYMLFIHLLDARGVQVGGADLPPGGAAAATSGWQTGRYLSLVQPVPTKADLPPGRYWVAVGIYDPQSFARLPLAALPPPANAPSDGEHALVLGPIEVAR